jgi:uncharacterized protein HemY
LKAPTGATASNKKSMLSQKDLRHLEAARAWLELSAQNWTEANEELDSIQATMRSHPEVLKVRIAIYLSAGRKDVALQITEHLERVYDYKGTN